MKKLVLIITIIVSILKINAQNVNIPDANFKAYLVGNALINTNSDSEIQLSEANSFTGVIGCLGENISNFTGLEEFTLVEQLALGFNPATSIDFTGNISLKFLTLGSNPITSIDLSANTLLEYLYIEECYSLQSIDLSNNQNLENVNIYLTSLTNLDLSTNLNITNIECSGNTSLTAFNVKNGNNTSITGFNATGNTNLTCIEVDDATYSTANWTNVDVTAIYNENCSGLSVPEFNLNNNITVFPNPTAGMLFLSNNFNVVLTDLTGKEVKQIQNTNSVDLSNQPKGLYFLVIKNGTGEVIQRERIIKH